MKKRALSLLLVFAMILSFVPTTALAAGGEENEITISETPSTDNQEGEPSTSNDSVEPGAGDAVGTANTEDQPDVEPVSDAEVRSAGTARDGEAAQNEITSGEISTEEELIAAVAGTTTGTEELTLTANINISQRVRIGRPVTLNLNGYTITSIDATCHSTLLVWPTDDHVGMEVTLKGGTIVCDEGYYGVYVDSEVKTLNLENVTITNNSDYSGGAYGVMIQHKSTATTATTTVNVTKSEITGNGGIYVSGTTSQASGSNPTNPSLDDAKKKDPPGIILKVDKDSTVTSKGKGFAAISGNGLDRSNPSITIEGTIDGGKTTSGIYLPQYGTTTVKAGAKISGFTGIAMKSGKLNIEGGTITGTSEYVVSPELKSGGVNSDGSAVFLESYAPPYAGDMEITIGKDATLTSTHSYALRENPNSNETAIKSITIADGAKLIASSSASAITTPIDLKEGSDDKIAIKGGNYSHPLEYKYLGVGEETEGLTWEAKATSGEAPYTYYAKLDDALDDGATSITKREATPSKECVTMKYDGTDDGKKYDVNYYNVTKGIFTIPEGTLEAKGKTFAGWKVNNTEGKIYQPEEKIENISADIILTAAWTVEGATVTFDYTKASGVSLDESNSENLEIKTDDKGNKTYTVADLTKPVTFKLTEENASGKDFKVTCVVGTNETELTPKDEVYTVGTALYTDVAGMAVGAITIKVELVNKATVTFNKLPTGVTLKDLNNLTTATDYYTVNDKTKDAKFGLKDTKDTKTYTVEYTVGEGTTKKTLTPDTNGNYTIPAADLAQNVTVTVTEKDKYTITLDKGTVSQVASIEPITANSNLTGSAPTYVAADVSKPIYFKVTEVSNAQFDKNTHIVVRYKLNSASADTEGTTLSPTSVSDSDPKEYAYTLNAADITGNITITVTIETTPVYEADPVVTIEEKDVAANIEAAQKQGEPLTIDTTAENSESKATQSEVTLSGDVVKVITDSAADRNEPNVDLTVKTDAGEVEFTAETISEIAAGNDLTPSDPITVVVEDQGNQIPDELESAGVINLFDVTLKSGNKQLDVDEFTIKGTITLVFQIAKNLKNPALYRLVDDGTQVELAGVKYDSETGRISGRTNHLSQFGVRTAPDTSITQIVGVGINTLGNHTEKESPEEVLVNLPSGSDADVVNEATIDTNVDVKNVTLYSDEGYTTPVESVSLTDDTTIVYVTVTNGLTDRERTAYYKFTITKTPAESDVSLKSVLGVDVKNTSDAERTGEIGTPYLVTITLPDGHNGRLTSINDIKATVGTVEFYKDDPEFKADSKNTLTSPYTLAFTGGIAKVYATVTTGTTTAYYEIQIAKGNVATLEVTVGATDGKVTVKKAGQTVTNNLYYAIVPGNPESIIATWNQATTPNEAREALKNLDESLTQWSSLSNSTAMANTDNSKYIVVIESSSSSATANGATIVSAGMEQIRMDVSVTIPSGLTVKNGNNTVASGTKVPYNTTLTLSTPNGVVFADGKPVTMKDGEGTYIIKANTTFTVVAGFEVNIENPDGASLDIFYMPSTTKVPLSVGTNMVPNNANLQINVPDNYIVKIDGVVKDLTADSTYKVTKNTTITVVRGYDVTIDSDDIENADKSSVIFIVRIGSTPITGTQPIEKDTELTIKFDDETGKYKVQLNGQVLTFSEGSTTVPYKVTADTTIKVVTRGTADIVDKLTVAADPTTGIPSVTKEGEPVTGDVIYAVVTNKPDFTDWTNDITEDNVLDELKKESADATSVTPPLTATHNNKYLVAFQIGEDGKVIAAGCSTSRITVSSPTTSSGYTVSGTVSAGTTGAALGGILVTLKGNGVTYSTTVNADGTYQFADVKTGTYGLEIALNAASKYDAVNQDVTVGTENVTVPTITLAGWDIDVWGGLTLGSNPVAGGREQFTIGNMKAGMYYSITTTLTGSKPNQITVKANENTFDLTTAEGTIIDVIEYSTQIVFDTTTGEITGVRSGRTQTNSTAE